MLLPERLDTEAVLRVGEVTAVTGRKIFISVDTDKNLSELFFDGDVLRNIAVGSYIDIRKGFLSLIGKVEGENARGEDKPFGTISNTEQRQSFRSPWLAFSIMKETSLEAPKNSRL